MRRKLSLDKVLSSDTRNNFCAGARAVRVLVIVPKIEEDYVTFPIGRPM